MASSAMSIIFTKLEKFNGEADLESWLRGFDRCCLVANKTDDLVKGQLLLLFVEKRARAVLEELEEEKGAPQKFTECRDRLKTVFDTAASRESKMADFETRIQGIEESEDEFMLILLRLYRAANPGASPDDTNTAIKRKFLQGISPELKRGIFVFCTDPYASTVSREQLLQACRHAVVHLTTDEKPKRSEVNAIQAEANQESILAKALTELTTTLKNHMDVTNNKLEEHNEQLTAIADRNQVRSNFSGFNRRRYRDTRQPGSQQQTGRGSGDTDSGRGRGRSPATCYKCGRPNHYARNCLSGQNSGNY